MIYETENGELVDEADSIDEEALAAARADERRKVWLEAVEVIREYDYQIDPAQLAALFRARASWDGDGT